MASLVASQLALRPLQGSRLAVLRSRQQPARIRRVQVSRATAEPETEEKPSYPTPAAYGLKTDSAGITVIDVVEPKAYVAEGASSSAGIAIAGTLAALAGAAAVLFFLGSKSVESDGLTLSQYIQKFEMELAAPAPEVEVVSVTAVDAPAVAPEVEIVTVTELAAPAEVVEASVAPTAEVVEASVAPAEFEEVVEETPVEEVVVGEVEEVVVAEVEAPAVEASAVEVPAVEAPVIEVPAVEAPALEAVE